MVMIAGNLTQLLRESHQKLGYSLSEDEDFIYLWQNGQRLAVYNAHAACLDKIDQFITDREIVENMNDFWMHQGRED